MALQAEYREKMALHIWPCSVTYSKNVISILFSYFQFVVSVTNYTTRVHLAWLETIRLCTQLYKNIYTYLYNILVFFLSPDAVPFLFHLVYSLSLSREVGQHQPAAALSLCPDVYSLSPSPEVGQHQPAAALFLCPDVFPVPLT